MVRSCVLLEVEIEVENRIQQLRKALGLSQRQLAEMVGTSQQQIQRIETGRTVARVEMAARISSALEKPLNIVFPGAAKALRDANKEMMETRTLPHDVWNAMQEIGLEGDPRIWTLKVILNGHHAPFNFQISGHEHSRLYSTLQNERESGEMNFAVFDTENRRCALNLSEVSFHQFLFNFDDTSVASNPEEDPDVGDEDINDCTVEILLRGRQEPIALVVSPDEPEDEEDPTGQCGDIFYTLETYTQPSDRFRLTDIDGEDAFIRAGDIALLSVPLPIIEPSEYEDGNRAANET